MSTATKIPCSNPRLCRVTFHRPGTQAPCKAGRPGVSGARTNLLTPPSLSSPEVRDHIEYLPDEEFTHTIQDVTAAVEGFDEDLVDGDMSEARFALASIEIADVQTGTGALIAMSDQEIIEMGDSEYMEHLVNVVKTEGPDAFPPSVVVEREGHYEWLDGQHRMTALQRSGVETVQAYVQRIF